MRRMHALLAAALMVPVAATASDSVQMKAGRWQESSTITSVTIDGRAMPLELLQNAIEPSFTCITPEQALDPARYFTDQGPDVDCETPRGSVAGGRIALASTCRFGDNGPSQVAVTGTYSPDAYRVAVRTDGTMNGRPMAVQMTIDGRFTGPCIEEKQEQE